MRIQVPLRIRIAGIWTWHNELERATQALVDDVDDPVHSIFFPSLSFAKLITLSTNSATYLASPVCFCGYVYLARTLGSYMRTDPSCAAINKIQTPIFISHGIF
jgi:hypothetical protein